MEHIYLSAERHGIPKGEAYTYDMLAEDLRCLKKDFPDIPIFSIGSSIEGRDILSVKIGSGSRKIFISGAYHGMEWLTAKVCIEFARELLRGALQNPECEQAIESPLKSPCDLYVEKQQDCFSIRTAVLNPVGNVSPARFLSDVTPFSKGGSGGGASQRNEKVNCPKGKSDHPGVQRGAQISVYIVPMVNPDGVELASGGLRWQANARGVDLNHNFDALWSLSRKTEEALGIVSPCASKFGGGYPESEPESRAVASFVRENNFDLVAALHSQGEVIYYDFCGIAPEPTEDYLSRFEAVSSYVRDIPSGTAICGGFKDWFIKRFKRPGFTIEIGKGENPLPLSQFDEVYSGVRGILFELMRQGNVGIRD